MLHMVVPLFLSEGWRKAGSIATNAGLVHDVVDVQTGGPKMMASMLVFS